MGSELKATASAIALKPSEWAEQFYMLPDGQFRFGPFEYLRAPLDDRAGHVVVLKSSQKGFTEMAMARAFHAIDIEHRDVLYLFPTSQVAADWSAGRFDVARRRSPRLRNLFTDVKNVHHKVAGVVNFYARGSNSPSQLESVPVDFLVIDEFDRMHRGRGLSSSTNYDSVSLARARLNASLNPQEMDIGTPTIPGYGISQEWEQSTRHQWFIVCPRCGRHELLRWPVSVVWTEGSPETARYRCTQCHGEFSGEEMFAAGGEWVAEAPDHAVHGYRISGLFAPRRSLQAIVAKYERSCGDDTALAVFHNNELGDPYTSEGSGLTDMVIERCMGDYQNGTLTAEPVVMGVDVGTVLHVEIEGGDTVLWAGTVHDFEDLDSLMEEWGVRMVVIDAAPERRKAREFVERWPGMAWLAEYCDGRTELSTDEKRQTVKVDRTDSLDALLARFRRGEITIPRGLPAEYQEHFKALRRVIVMTNQGEPKARFVNIGADHFAHAANYALVAAKVLAGMPDSDIWEEIDERGFLG